MSKSVILGFQEDYFYCPNKISQMDNALPTDELSKTKANKFRFKPPRKQRQHRSQLVINNKTITLHFYNPNNTLSSIPSPSIPSNYRNHPEIWGCILPKDSQKIFEDNMMKQTRFLPKKKPTSLSPKKIKQNQLASEQLLLKYLKRKERRNMKEPLVFKMLDRKDQNDENKSNLLKTIFNKRFVSLDTKRTERKNQSGNDWNKKSKSIFIFNKGLKFEGNSNYQDETFNLTKVQLKSRLSNLNTHLSDKATIQEESLTQRKKKFIRKNFAREDSELKTIDSLYKTDYIGFNKKDLKQKN